MEGLSRVGGEIVFVDRRCGTGFPLWVAIYQLIKQLAIVSYNVGDIIAVFESSFDFEGCASW